MSDNDIFKSSKGQQLNTSVASVKSRGKSQEPKVNLNNEWIPTEAVRVIQKIKEQFKGQMTETCVSQILYELNGIWRTIMRKECDAIKKKYTMQIQDLRRQLVTKKVYDGEEAQKEISRLKKEL